MKFLLIVAGLLFAASAQAHIAGHPEWDEWLMAQVRPNNIGGICCDKSDAYVLDAQDIRVKDGEIEANIDGQWITFPNTGQGQPGNTILATSGNPTGAAVAWVLRGVPLCFTGGAGT